MQPLDLVTEQLWAPAFATGDLRVTTTGGAAGWVDVERYWLVPDRARARLLLPRGPAAITHGAAVNYRGLRPPAANAVRSLGGRFTRLGLPLGLSTARVQVRADRTDQVTRLPLDQLAVALEHPRLYASLGVRRGANRKATLALIDGAGAPVGYAKVGWNSISDDFVTTESQTLARIGGRAGAMRAPRPLATIDYFGHPILVTEPLPLDARGARHRLAPPSSEEFYSLMPVHRSARPIDTDHLRQVGDRLSTLSAAPLTEAPAMAARRLLERIGWLDTEVPVTEFWHGDLSPWNAARSGDGALWVWDWETAEDDVVAGLDPLHWVFSEHRLAARRLDDIRLAEVMAQASPHLGAAGAARRTWPIITAVYTLTVVERASLLARRNGTWADVWIGPETLQRLVRQAEALLP